MVEDRHVDLVSVIMPCYNHESFVQEAIRAIMNQSYTNIELIIIDDGSKDNSVKKIQEMVPACQKRFVRFEFINRENRGLCNTLNEGIDWCRGKYLSLAASDDRLFSDKTLKQVEELKKLKEKNVVGIFSGFLIFENERDVVKIEKGIGQIVSFEDIFLRKVPPAGQTSMFLRNKVIESGGYDPLCTVDDLYISLKLTEKGEMLYMMEDVLVEYRRHGCNLSGQNVVMQNGVNQILSQYKNHPLYKKAVAASTLVNAHSMQAENKIKGFIMAIESFKIAPSIFFSKSSLKFFIKQLIPSFWVRFLRKKLLK